MTLPDPSPMERHILDFLTRIESEQQQRIAQLETRIATLQAQNAGLMARIDALEQGQAALSNSLAGFLAPPGLPRRSTG